VATLLRAEDESGDKKLWWEDKGVQLPTLPLYGLPELQAAAPDQPVYFVEGEKACDALRGAGAVAVTTAGGASRRVAGSCLEPLLGRTVILWPDNDAPGSEFALRVAGELSRLGVQAQWLEVPGMPPKGDAADYIAEGRTLDELGQFTGPVPAASPAREKLLLTVDELELQSGGQWLIEGVIPEGLAALIGDFGSGKTFVLLDMACSVATGQNWQGMPSRSGYAVYVSAEGRSGLSERIRAWENYHGVPARRLRVVTVPLQLLADGDVNALLKALQQELPEPPTVIIIDTLARAMVGGDENGQKDMGVVVAAAERLHLTTGATVIFAHHTNRDGAYRGSSAFPGALDALAKVTTSGGRLRLSCLKMRNGADFPPVHLQLVPHHESLVVQRIGSSNESIPSSQKDEHLLNALRPSGDQGMTGPDWMRTSGARKSTFYRKVDQLAASGLVRHEGGKWFMAPGETVN